MELTRSGGFGPENEDEDEKTGADLSVTVGVAGLDMISGDSDGGIGEPQSEEDSGRFNNEVDGDWRVGEAQLEADICLGRVVTNLVRSG